MRYTSITGELTTENVQESIDKMANAELFVIEVSAGNEQVATDAVVGIDNISVVVDPLLPDNKWVVRCHEGQFTWLISDDE